MVDQPKPKPGSFPPPAGAMLKRMEGYSATKRASSRLAMKPPLPPPAYMWMPSGCRSPTTRSAP